MLAFTAHLLEVPSVPAPSGKRKKAGASSGARSRPENVLVWRGGGRGSRRPALRELIHLVQEILVALRQLELVQQELHRLHRIQLRERFPEEPNLLELVLLEQQLFLAGARLLD